MPARTRRHTCASWLPLSRQTHRQRLDLSELFGCWGLRGCFAEPASGGGQLSPLPPGLTQLPRAGPALLPCVRVPPCRPAPSPLAQVSASPACCSSTPTSGLPATVLSTSTLRACPQHLAVQPALHRGSPTSQPAQEPHTSCSPGAMDRPPGTQCCMEAPSSAGGNPGAGSPKHGRKPGHRPAAGAALHGWGWHNRVNPAGPRGWGTSHPGREAGS